MGISEVDQKLNLVVICCMQYTFVRARTRPKGSHQAKRARDDRVSCIQSHLPISVFDFACNLQNSCFS